MSVNKDFETSWLEKFSNALEEIAGEEIRKKVMQGVGTGRDQSLPASQSDQKQVIEWTKKAMKSLESLVDINKVREIMTRCACQYPLSELKDVRKQYEETKDIGLAHRMLQEKFESFLKDNLNLSDELIEEIARQGWGLAGILKDNTIIATKIPKSGNLVKYMEETDPEIKRQYYCHCPRVRDILINIEPKENISPLYCYCGAGFYKGIWEEILQKPVKVELLESIFKGDDVCKFAIHLPIV
ncbi:MAG: hypothetical protein H8D45_29515 [Bacteroidetes bacterium]|nr:hypothetical protein [Bacteroidota bacterium]